MSISLDDVSIVYWFPDRDKHRCGYCKQENCGISYGMWADSMTVDDYQDIIDRGWRRSGKYCYKPIMNETCCPQYTIRCDTMNFKLSKSQKKVIKRFNKYLSDGTLRKEPTAGDVEATEAEPGSHIIIKERPEVMADYWQMDKKMKIDELSPAGESKASCSRDTLPPGDAPQPAGPEVGVDAKRAAYKKGIGADPNKPPSRKAKRLRIERKRRKLEARGLTLEAQQARDEKEVKSLTQYLTEMAGDPKHKLEMKMFCTSVQDDQLTANIAVGHKVYQKYQMLVHNDPPEKCSLQSFKRFLVHSPLKAKTSAIDESVTFGSYHQQYWIDGKLIAVGVIDILPRCVSSVYFFYDPEYRNLTLGTYGSLREVEFAQKLNKKIPELKYYYMGFYIHSCSKMRYKGKLYSSALLCPETYDWFPIAGCVPKLDASKYSRLNDDALAVDAFACTPSDVESIKILIGYQYTTFRHYRYKSRDLHVFQTIGRLIGRKSIGRFMFIQQKS